MQHHSPVAVAKAQIPYRCYNSLIDVLLQVRRRQGVISHTTCCKPVVLLQFPNKCSKPLVTMTRTNRSLRCSSQPLLTVVDEVLEDLFSAGLNGMMQQRAAGVVLQQEIRPLLVELHQLHMDKRTASETFEGFRSSRWQRAETHSLGSGLQSWCSPSTLHLKKETSVNNKTPGGQVREKWKTLDEEMGKTEKS